MAALELLRFRPRLSDSTTNLSPAAATDAIPVHRLAARVSLIALAAVIGIRLAHRRSVLVLPPVGALEWLAFASVGLATIACLWDAVVRSSVAALAGRLCSLTVAAPYRMPAAAPASPRSITTA